MLPLHKLKGMWSTTTTVTPPPKKLSLPLAPTAIPAAPATAPVLHFTIRPAGDKTPTAVLPPPVAQGANLRRMDFGVAVFVRGARNVPLDKCGMCHGRLQRLDHLSFQVHLRCFSGEGGGGCERVKVHCVRECVGA